MLPTSTAPANLYRPVVRLPVEAGVSNVPATTSYTPHHVGERGRKDHEVAHCRHSVKLVIAGQAARGDGRVEREHWRACY
eukprot:5378327-Prymnesium_polylepis.1